MLEKPPIPDERIAGCLRDAYGLHAAQIDFLPLGADRNTAVYRAHADGAPPRFVKLRRGAFDEASAAVPHALHSGGIAAVMAPLETRAHVLSTPLDDYRVMVYPYVEGRNGYQAALTDAQWAEFGRALRGIHDASLPPGVSARVPRETWPARWREQVAQFQSDAARMTFNDPVSAGLAALLRDQRAAIDAITGQAARLARALQVAGLPLVVCHTDLHAGNLLIEPGGALHIVDWDAPLLAPKERDLMFIGGGLLGGWLPPGEEEARFYAGYGAAAIDPLALAYYRYERIVQDIAAYCEEIWQTEPGNRDRPVGLRQLQSQFAPGEVVELAFRTERLLPAAYRLRG